VTKKWVPINKTVHQFTRFAGLYLYKAQFNEEYEAAVLCADNADPKLGAKLLVRTNLGEKISLVPHFFLTCALVFILPFDFIPSFGKT